MRRLNYDSENGVLTNNFDRLGGAGDEHAPSLDFELRKVEDEVDRFESGRTNITLKWNCLVPPGIDERIRVKLIFTKMLEHKVKTSHQGTPLTLSKRSYFTAGQRSFCHPPDL